MTERHPPRPRPGDGSRPPETTAPADESGPPQGQSARPAGAEPATAEEMGGEAPCQLHNFWDVDE